MSEKQNRPCWRTGGRWELMRLGAAASARHCRTNRARCQIWERGG